MGEASRAPAIPPFGEKGHHDQTSLWRHSLFPFLRCSSEPCAVLNASGQLLSLATSAALSSARRCTRS